MSDQTTPRNTVAESLKSLNRWRMNKHNTYGYKVCYRERGKVKYVCYFKTYTYEQAVYSKAYYIRFTTKSRDDSHTLINPIWRIRPITRKEVLAGCWRDVPF
jgi:hypothetical protein